MTRTKTENHPYFRRLMLLAGILFVAIFFVRPPTTASSPPNAAALDPNPLPPFPSVELEQLTWIDVRDRIRDGARRIILPTGGVEQNGPFVSLSKHNLVARAVSVRTAEILGATLVAPIVAFVPQGKIAPPTEHMRFPGTISVQESTFEALLEDLSSSLSVHGFTEIVLVGDSAGNQRGLQRAAERLNKRFHGTATRALYIPEFYNYPELRRFLATKGIQEQSESFHEELVFSLQLLVLSPVSIRYDQRLAAGHSTLGGVSLLDREKLVALGKEMLELRAQTTATAIRAHATAR